jgi:hypothetical protein
MKIHPSQILEPSQISSCKCWYEFNYSNGKDITNYVSGNPITSVKNLINDGNFPSTLVSTLTERPTFSNSGYLNNKSAVFDGVNDSLMGGLTSFIPFNSMGTALIVVKANSLMNSKTIWAFDAANHRIAIRYHSDLTSLRFIFSSNGSASTAVIVLNILDIYTDYLFLYLTRSNNIWTIGCNGRSNTVTNSTNPSINNLTLNLGFDSGSSGYLNGKIDMFAFFSESLSNEDITKIFDRFKNRKS